MKDISRFGRNYIEVGDYLEQVFPFLGIRFISVNDQYDSEQEYHTIGGIEVALRILLSDLYCKDISQKVKTSFATRRKKGDYVAAYAPFGYKKSDINRHKLVIDEEAAKIVRTIFTLALEGKRAKEIAQILNNDKVLTRGQYKTYVDGIATYQLNRIHVEDTYWTDIGIWAIIHDETYVGTVVSGKSERIQIGCKKTRDKPKREWIRIPHMHEAIVTEEEFVLANKYIKTIQKKSIAKERYLYAKIRCHHCNHTMVRHRKQHPVYYCHTPKFKESPECVIEPTSEVQIEEVLLAAMQEQARVVLDLERTRVKKQEQIVIQRKELESTIHQYERVIKNLTTIRQESYEDYVEERISREAFIEKKTSYNKQIDQFVKQIGELQDRIENNEQKVGKQEHLIERWSQVLELTCLSKELVDTLVDNIVVYDKEHIEICWNYKDNYMFSDNTNIGE